MTSGHLGFLGRMPAIRQKQPLGPHPSRHDTERGATDKSGVHRGLIDELLLRNYGEAELKKRHNSH